MLSKLPKRWLLSALALAALTGTGTARPAGVEAVLFELTPGGAETRVMVARPGAPSREIGRFASLPDGALRGALVGDAVACVAEVDAARDRSWTAHLIVVQGGQARTLATGLYAGSWPVPDGPGHVLVTRGQPGPVSGRLETRVDPIAIERIELATGAAETLLRWDGFLALPLGRVGSEVVIYRIGPAGAEVVAASAAGKLRVVSAVVPMARDFSLDPRGGALVYQNREADAWVVERMDLATGQRRTLLRADHYGLAPALLPGGEALLANLRPGAGFSLVPVVVGARMRLITEGPAGRGADESFAMTDGRVAFLHRGDGPYPEPWLLDLGADHATRLPATAGARVEIAGLRVAR